MLPKAYLLTERDVLKDFSKLELKDEVAALQYEITQFLERPAMWVGSGKDFSGILHVLTEKMSLMAHLCKSLDLHHFWNECKFGATGPHQMRFIDGLWDEKHEKTPKVFMEDLKKHVDLFYKWIPHNIVLFEEDLYLPQFEDKTYNMVIPPDKELSELPEILSIRAKIVKVLEDNNIGMTHVYVDGIYWISGIKPHIKFTVLKSPVDQSLCGADKARTLGFK